MIIENLLKVKINILRYKNFEINNSIKNYYNNILNMKNKNKINEISLHIVIIK